MAAIGGAALVTALSSSALSAQISPGALARPHASLEGALNCVKCHGPKRADLSASCQACHRDISWLQERNRGYHAGRDARSKKDCAACHPDHAGSDFALIAWPGGARDRFDHRAAGWALEGAHLAARCEACHTAKYRVSESASLSKRRDGAGWVGLETTCVSCHREDDPHRGALDARCQTCHDTRDWKPAPLFSHDSTDYPLTGKHTAVACGGCHLSKRLPLRRDASGTPIPVYSPVPFASCASCHEDPHQGRFSARCADCHSTTSFASVEGRGFNHAQTRYPLRGRHARVSCAACHGPDLARPKPAFDACASCHSDPHQGQAELQGKPADCGACHRVEGFAPSTYTIIQHATAPYALEGRHLQVTCVKCHTPVARSAGSRVPAAAARMRMPFGRCSDCHADAHGGQLLSRPGGASCDRCHAVAGWTPSTFSLAAHARLRLPLEGRHAEIPCRACHAADRPGLPVPGPVDSLGLARVQVSLTGATCTTCHVDPHTGRYAPNGALPADCVTCHTATAFRPSRVDAVAHERFGFRLQGAHRAVSCAGCHQELRATPATSTLLRTARGVTRFPATPGQTRSCASCHANPHGDQFSARKDATCATCHGVESFVPAAGFDHDRDAAFSLKGAHAAVPCARCHGRQDVAGVSMTVYRPLSGKCESCHDRRPS